MLFRKNIERRCAHCVHASAVDDTQVKCSKKGIKNQDDQCFLFSYDPTKRVPKKAKTLDMSKYKEYDYSL